MQTGMQCHQFYDFKRISKHKNLNLSCPIEGLNYEHAWEAAGKTEFDVLLQLKSTISTKHNQTELEHALQYFEKYVYDFPGEFFLQMPFLFTVRI